MTKIETPLVKELRDQAARETKTADNPFEARTHRAEWRAAAEIEKLGATGTLQQYLDLIGSEFAFLRQCEDRTWIAAFWRDGQAVEAEGYSPEKALEKLLNTRAGAKPILCGADHDGETVGRTGGSSPPTGAIKNFWRAECTKAFRPCPYPDRCFEMCTLAKASAFTRFVDQNGTEIIGSGPACAACGNVPRPDCPNQYCAFRASAFTPALCTPTENKG